MIGHRTFAPAVQRRMLTPNAARVMHSDLPQQIIHVMERYPDLSAYGFHFRGPDAWDEVDRYRQDRAQMGTDDFAAQVVTCIEALTVPRSRRYAWKVGRHSSYVLKHMVEHWVYEVRRRDLASYVSNGAFIVAAVIDGWIPVRLENSPNCVFQRSAGS